MYPTHHCTKCGALWRQCDDGSWNLRSHKAGPCCDNVPMKEQIRPLAAQPWHSEVRGGQMVQGQPQGTTPGVTPGTEADRPTLSPQAPAQPSEQQEQESEPKRVLHSFSSIECEKLIQATVPGGSVCDPQEVADNIRRYLNAWPAAQPQKAAQPRLTVRVQSFPESTGKRNWTALLVRVDPWDGLIGNCGGITIARGEFWNRVAYGAECARALLGERDTEPFILDYGDDIMTPDQWAGEVRGGRPVEGGTVAARRALKPLTEAEAIRLWHENHDAHERISAFEWFAAGIIAGELAHGITEDKP